MRTTSQVVSPVEPRDPAEIAARVHAYSFREGIPELPILSKLAAPVLDAEPPPELSAFRFVLHRSVLNYPSYLSF